MVRRGKALRRSIGLVGAPLPVAFDHLLRRDGNTSATAIARKPPGPPMAVHGATSLQGRATEVRRRTASLPRPTTRRRAAEGLPRQDRTQLPAGAIPLRDLLPLRVHRAEVRAIPADTRAETRDLREAIRAGAED